MRTVLLALSMMLGLVFPALAQEENAWQQAVDGQIEALRAHDGPLALTFAAESFRTTFEKQPDAFYAAVVSSGYEPIAESRSHSFGEFNKISDTLVTQVVDFVGKDLKLYEALYQLVNEPDQGWRVTGVVMRQAQGMGA